MSQQPNSSSRHDGPASARQIPSDVNPHLAETCDQADDKAVELVRILDQHLATRRFVTGDSLTMGDIPVGASCYRYYGLPIARPQLPDLEEWYDRLTERRSFREHVMLPIT